VQDWWIFLHVASVLWFVGAHGASMVMLFRLRKERDPAKVDGYLQLSATSSRSMYVALGAVVVSGALAAFAGHWWGYGWIWAALGILVVTTLAMQYMARPYYRRVGTIARAMASGSQAVSSEQFERVLREPRPWTVAGLGAVALGAILYLMIFKPALGMQPTAAPVTVPTSGACSPHGTTVKVGGQDFSFDQRCLAAPAQTGFRLVFDDTQGTHNVAIYTDNTGSTALFRGDIVTGPRSITYLVPALPAGTYFFRCDVHPTQMTGAFVVGSATTPGSASP
jgi:plastocyanin